MSAESFRERARAWLDKLAWLDPRARRELERPQEELRFTRAAQGARWMLAGAVFFCASGALVWLRFVPWHADGTAALPGLSFPWIAAPLLPALFCWWVGVYCISHACLILSPVGVEIFPLLFPERGLRVVMWQEIRDARIEHGRLWLDLEEGRGVVVSLRPIRPARLELLWHAIEGRMAQHGPAE